MSHIKFDYSKVLDKFVAPHEVEYMQSQVTAADELIRKGTGAGSDFLGWLDLPENYDREEFDRILKEALRQNKPIMAICRGVQLVNVAFGGTLNQEIEGHWQGLPFGTSHSIETVEGSVVAKLFGKESQVNSVHRQSIKDLAPNFRVTAIDPRDQTIEAIESIDEHRIIGLQWHPEFLVNEEDGNLELFEYLLNEL